MRIGIVSDTHSNLNALQNVLEHMNSVGVDKKVHLGDTIGYGPKPKETLELTLEEFNYITMGNHDLACVDEEESRYFNPMAKKAIDWTRDRLSKEELDVLLNLSYGHKLNDTLFVHGSPQANNPHGYLLQEMDAKMAFSDPVTDFKIAFVGHTHVPFLWYEDSFTRPRFENTLKSNSHGIIGASEIGTPLRGRVIINIGSVGQPRDGDNRASYAIYDTDKEITTIYKIPYAVDVTIGQMQRAGFEDSQWQRLIYGR